MEEDIAQASGSGPPPTVGHVQLADDETDSDLPPELPKKTRQFLIGSNIGGVTLFGDQGRCPSPYDNVEEALTSPDLVTWHGESQGSSARHNFQQQKQFMSYSESRTTLVGIAGNGNDNEDRPPLPPKKKHSSKSVLIRI